MEEKAKPVLPPALRGEGVDAEQVLARHKAEAQEARRVDREQRRVEAEANRHLDGTDARPPKCGSERRGRPWVVRSATASDNSSCSLVTEPDTSEYAWDLYYGERY